MSCSPRSEGLINVAMVEVSIRPIDQGINNLNLIGKRDISKATVQIVRIGERGVQSPGSHYLAPEGTDVGSRY